MIIIKNCLDESGQPMRQAKQESNTLVFEHMQPQGRHRDVHEVIQKERSAREQWLPQGLAFK